MLLYLVKNSRPDIANSTRELIKCLTKASMVHYNEMLRVMKFVIQTRDLGLKLQISEPFKYSKEANKTIVWYLKAYSDASYASDKDNRLSVTGFIVYFMGAPISWRSRLQRQISLSSTESEYYAISDVVRELMYIRNILRSLGIEVGLPIQVYVDNLGAIFMAKNAASSVRTKHVDTHFHFIRDYYENGTLLVTFCNTVNMDADILTKNVASPIYDKHTPKLF